MLPFDVNPCSRSSPLRIFSSNLLYALFCILLWPTCDLKLFVPLRKKQQQQKTAQTASRLPIGLPQGPSSNCKTMLWWKWTWPCSTSWHWTALVWGEREELFYKVIPELRAFIRWKKQSSVRPNGLHRPHLSSSVSILSFFLKSFFLCSFLFYHEPYSAN